MSVRCNYGGTKTRLCAHLGCGDCHQRSFASHRLLKYWDVKKNDLRPRFVRKNSKTRYWFKCDKAHSFKAATFRVNKKTRWCYYCKASKLEMRVQLHLDRLGIDFIKEYNPSEKAWNRRYDFFLPEHGIIIETDGRQHFEKVKYFNRRTSFKKIQDLDRLKTACAISMFGYRILRIDYTSEEDIPNLVNYFLVCNEKWCFSKPEMYAFILDKPIDKLNEEIRKLSK